MGPKVLLKVYGVAGSTPKNRQVPQEITFYCGMQFIGERDGLWERMSVPALLADSCRA